MEFVLLWFFMYWLFAYFPTLIRIILGIVAIWLIIVYVVAPILSLVFGLLGWIRNYWIAKPYNWFDEKYVQKNKVLKRIFSKNWVYILIWILFIWFIAWGCYIPETYKSNPTNNNYVEQQNTNYTDISEKINLDPKSIVDDIMEREGLKTIQEVSPYSWCSYVWADWERHKCDNSLVDDSDYDLNDPINYNPERIDNTPIAVIPEAHIPTATIPKSQTPKTQNYYDWYDDPEPSEFYEYDNFDDYYDNYWSYYDDYSYDELKDMYDDERENDRPYQEYDDYYDDIWYDYYWWYDWYDNHYDDYVDEYWYED